MMESQRKTYRRLVGRPVLFQFVRSALMLLAGAPAMPNLDPSSHFRSIPVHRFVAYW